MTQEPKKRWWLRFGIRGMLLFMLLIAIGFRFVLPGQIPYHKSIATANEPEFKKTALGFWNRARNSGAKIELSYHDLNNDGVLDMRFGARQLLVVFRECVRSEAIDREGNFDEELHIIFVGFGQNLKYLYSWTKQIHIAVPKTTP